MTSKFCLLLSSITLALSLLARRLSSAPRYHSSLSMITGARRGVENAAPAPAEKLAKTMATKSIGDAPTSSSADEFPPLRVKKLVPEALLPVRGSAGAAGYDLAR